MEKTPISQLQELMAKSYKPAPIYQDESFGMQFKCTVKVDGVTAIGIGPTKKHAKHESAKAALAQLNAGKIGYNPVIPPISQPTSNTNYVGELNEFASKHVLPYPVYECLTSSQFLTQCRFVKHITTGTGVNKKEAKQSAAKAMLLKVNSSDIAAWKKEEEKSLNAVDQQKILELMKQVSIYSNTCNNTENDENSDITATPGIKLDQEDSLKVLKEKVKQYNISYTCKTIQRNPYVLSVQINDSNAVFLGIGPSEDEAMTNALQYLLTAKKYGCSLNTTL